MKINWKVRLTNPQFWINLGVSVIGILLAYFGLNWSELTSWGAFGKLFADAAQNPVVVFAVLASVWNAIQDPTTRGIGDSKRALGYDRPSK